MVSVDHFGRELRSQMTRAEARGATEILIKGSDLCRVFLESVTARDACNNAMRAELKSGDIVFIEAAMGVGMTVQYQLPRTG